MKRYLPRPFSKKLSRKNLLFLLLLFSQATKTRRYGSSEVTVSNRNRYVGVIKVTIGTNKGVTKIIRQAHFIENRILSFFSNPLDSPTRAGRF
jgi:hypothetical protein